MRKSSHPNPTIKFFNIKHLLHSIDDVDSDVKNGPNYDESESDNDNGVNLDQNARKKPTFTPSTHLPDDDNDIDLASTELEETLADKPLPKKGKGVAMSPMDVAESEQEDEDEPFELASWV